MTDWNHMQATMDRMAYRVIRDVRRQRVIDMLHGRLAQTFDRRAAATMSRWLKRRRKLDMEQTA